MEKRAAVLLLEDFEISCKDQSCLFVVKQIIKDGFYVNNKIGFVVICFRRQK